MLIFRYVPASISLTRSKTASTSEQPKSLHLGICVCTCIYIYIYIYAHIFNSIYTCIFAFLSTLCYHSICVSYRVYIHICTHTYICVYIYIYIYACSHLCICTYRFTSVSVFISSSVSLYITFYSYIYICLNMHINAYKAASIPTCKSTSLLYHYYQNQHLCLHHSVSMVISSSYLCLSLSIWLFLCLLPSHMYMLICFKTRVLGFRVSVFRSVLSCTVFFGQGSPEVGAWLPKALIPKP